MTYSSSEKNPSPTKLKIVSLFPKEMMDTPKAIYRTLKVAFINQSPTPAVKVIPLYRDNGFPAA